MLCLGRIQLCSMDAEDPAQHRVCSLGWLALEFKNRVQWQGSEIRI